MYAIIGLGNPGKEYTGSRHNLGFRVIETLAVSLSANRPSRHRWSIYTVVRIGSEKAVLAQPMTYMNRSGRAVDELFHLYPLQPEQLVLIYDDLDLPPGSLRLRQGGGSGGHRGVQSVIEHLGSASFIRLRLGIGRPPSGLAGADYVLQKPSPEDKPLLEQAVDQAVEAVITLVRLGLDAAMNRFNRSLQI
ncbi:MAG: aminoacyl-tRNA hydrolase [Bacillota bacterium]